MMFNGNDIANIARDKESFKRAIELSDIKNSKGETVFNGYSIADIADNIETYKRALVLSDIKNTKGETVFNGYSIADIADNIETYKRALVLSDIKNSKGETVFDQYSIARMAHDRDIVIDDEFKKRVIKLANIRNSAGKMMFNGNDIANITDDEETYKKALALSDIKNSDGRMVFSRDEIYYTANSGRIVVDDNFKKRAIELSDMHFTDSDGVNKRIFMNEDSLTSFLADTRISNNDIPPVLAQWKKVLANPDLYINGIFDNQKDKIDNVNHFFTSNFQSLTLASSTLDKEALNELLRTRFDDAEEYLETIESFNKDDIARLKGLCSSCNIDNKPFMPTQKIDSINLISAYKENRVNTDKIDKMINEGRVDFGELNINLFHNMLHEWGFSDNDISQIPTDKLTSWDTKYIHLLSKEINEEEDDDDEEDIFKNIIIAANKGNFKDFIQDELNIYGKTNKKTKKIFESSGLNYDKWVNPSESLNIQFVSKDKNKERLSQIKKQIEEDIEDLRKTPAKSFVDKQLFEFIKNDKFEIPNEFIKSKEKLNEFCKNAMTDLDSIFKRAGMNKDNPTRKATAENTLTIKSHLLQRLDDIKNASEIKSKKEYDLTIKMWDRIPQKDLFQGNYSTCCIGMDGGNGCAMPHYLANTAFNMIELLDNKSGKIIGNALCYFTKDKNNKPAFIVDNIEIKNSEKPSDEIGIELRNAIVKYAKNVSKEVTGNNDTQIFMSSCYNDVPIDDLEHKEKQAKFLGKMDCDEIYLDLYDGWEESENLNGNQKMLKLG